MQIVARTHQIGVAVLRIAVGIIFLWAGLEKLLGSGAQAWTAAGFLKGATAGSLSWPFVTGTPAAGAVYNPTHQFWVDLAGNSGAMTVVNFLVIAGEIGIGIALILGLLTRFGATMGALMMLLFFFAAWSFSTGIVNQHLTYMVVCLAIAGLGAGKYYGLDGWAGQTSFARNKRWFRRWFLSGDPVESATA
jgi:thiosulfate dehydrogenase [quinone] large subunit